MRRPFRYPLLAATCLWLGGCYAAPGPDAPKGPVRTLQRILAPDLSTHGFAGREQGLAAATRFLAQEPARLRHVAPAAERLGTGALRDLGNVPERLASLARTELSRRPAVPSPVLGVPTSAQLRADLHRVGHRLLLSKEPLGEIDDLPHRTDPDDDRPEAGLLARVRRRLHL